MSNVLTKRGFLKAFVRNCVFLAFISAYWLLGLAIGFFIFKFINAVSYQIVSIFLLLILLSNLYAKLALRYILSRYD